MTTDAGGSVWVCVPTFNERENVADLVRATRAVLERTVADGHVLVIDDSSPDGTGAIVEEIARTDTRVHLLQRPQKEGIGPAYRAGFRYALDAGAQRIVEMDCDFSHDPDDIPRLLEATQHSDVAIGSRYVAGGGVRNWGAIRRLISRGGCLYAQGILWVPVRDLTGGFKCFRRRVLETIPLDQVAGQGYGFQIEMTYRALQQGFVVREIPITFTNRARGTSKMSGHIVREAAILVPRLRRTVGGRNG